MNSTPNPNPKMSAHEYRSLVEAFAKNARSSIRDPNLDLLDDVMKLSERECEGYDVERLCALLSYADKNCVADAVLLVTDNHNLARFDLPKDVIRRLAVRALALEAQEVAHHG